MRESIDAHARKSFYHAAARFAADFQSKKPSVSKFFDGSHRFISTTANPRAI